MTIPEDVRSTSLYARAMRRLQLRIANWFDADGGWREYADNYSPLVLQSLLLYAETEFQRGQDIYHLDFGANTIPDICQWFVRVLPPDGVLPAIGDGHWLQSLDPGLLRLCGIRSSDPTLVFGFERYSYGREHFPSRNYYLTYLFDTIAWSDSSLASQHPAWTSDLLSGSGLAVLRSGWHAEAQYLLLEFTDDGVGGHHHQSFGNVVL